MPKAKPATLVEVIRRRYDVNELRAPVEVLEWATMRVAEEVGIPAAARQLCLLNRKRYRMGVNEYHPRWGHPLFEPYYEACRARDGGSR